MAKLISADLTNNKLCILEYTTTDGQMLSFEEEAFDAKIVSHTYTVVGKIIFQKPITEIKEKAFFYNNNLLSITIPDSVTSIGNSAFGACDSLQEFKGKFASEDGRCLIIDGTLNAFAPAGLTEYTIPNSVTAIGEWAFSWCESLTSVTIPDSVTEIGESAFNDCSNLTSVTIPDSVTTIEGSAFSYCNSLTSVTIPDSVTTIEDSAFSYCNSLTSVTIPDSVTTIGDYAFYECSSLTSVTISDSVTTIGVEAFGSCTSLTSVTIPDSVTMIGDSAFADCESLTSVTIPDSVTMIGDSAFFCTNLKEFKGKFAADGGRCLIIDGVLNAFALGCGATQYTIPDSVTTIGSSAFDCCTSLISVTIGDNVTTIGYKAFACCKNLTSITIPNSVTTIGWWAFSDCPSLTSVTIGKSVSEIGEEAFKGCNINTIVCYPKIPPKIDNSFGKFENLIVPTGCEAAYANSDWGQYLE